MGGVGGGAPGWWAEAGTPIAIPPLWGGGNNGKDDEVVLAVDEEE